MGQVCSSSGSVLGPPRGPSSSTLPDKPRHRPFKKGSRAPSPAGPSPQRLRVGLERERDAAQLLLGGAGLGWGTRGCRAGRDRGLAGASGWELAGRDLKSVGRGRGCSGGAGGGRGLRGPGIAGRAGRSPAMGGEGRCRAGRGRGRGLGGREWGEVQGGGCGPRRRASRALVAPGPDSQRRRPQAGPKPWAAAPAAARSSSSALSSW